MTKNHLRDCPMCKTPPNNESKGPGVTVTNGVDLDTGEEWGSLGYTVTCMTCGATVQDEYLEEAVRIWNGKPPVTDDEDTPNDH